MNTTMADGASERLDAQIADALFGQPGMSKLDVANRLRELRGNGGALLGSAAYPAAWMWPHPEDGTVRFTADGDVASEAVSMGRAVSALYRVPVQESAQTSPAGQGDALPPLPEMRVIGAGRHPPVKLHRGYTAEQMRDYAQAALAARQPVGESPLEMRICELRNVSLRPNRPYIFTVDPNCANCRADAAYAMGNADTPPAQAVDLADFKALYRAYVRLLESDDLDLQAARRVIDSKAVG